MNLKNGCDDLPCPGLSDIPRHSRGSARRYIENLLDVVIWVLVQVPSNKGRATDLRFKSALLSVYR